MELQTAKRKDYDTSLKWIRMEKNKILSVIDTDGAETKIETIEQLCKMYTPVADNSLFATYVTNKKDKGSKMSKKQPQEKPKNLKRPEPPQGQTPNPNTNTLSENVDDTVLPVGDKVSYAKEVEVLYTLQMSDHKEVIFEMDFEDFADLQYRKIKLSEKYPTYTFKLKTLRSVVSYADI